MTKKKILSLCMVGALAATAVGGTLAYFTDTDSENNTFTTGGVAIELHEKQVNAEGSALEDFKQDQVLMPIVGSAQGEKDDFGQPIAANYIDKIVTIENTSKSDAWVRAYFAIPSALDDGNDTYNAGLNILHFNFGNEDGQTTFGDQWLWKKNDGSWKYFETEINDTAYNVYYADYYQPLAPDEITEQFISGVYLDKGVDMDKDGNYTITRDGVTTAIEDFDGNAVCPVAAVAVQAAGFDSADAAVTEAFGANFNPFAEQ